MPKLYGDILKAGLALFLVGAMLAYASPLIATALGGDAALGITAAVSHPSVLWTAGFFGGFGMLNAAISPACDYLFGDNKKTQEIVENKPPTQTFVHAPQQHLHIHHQPELNQAVADNFHSNYAQKISEERVQLSQKLR